MPLNLLVIASQRINYYELFAGQEVLGEAIIVEQCAWDDLRLCSHGGNGGLVASISPSTKPMPGTPQDRPRHMVPDMVLLRASCMGGPKVDWRPLLSTMIHSGVPTINSAFSFLVSQDRVCLPFLSLAFNVIVSDLSSSSFLCSDELRLRCTEGS